MGINTSYDQFDLDVSQEKDGSNEDITRKTQQNSPLGGIQSDDGVTPLSDIEPDDKVETPLDQKIPKVFL